MLENRKAILMNTKDNVAMVLEPIKENDRVAIIYDHEVIDYVDSQENIDIYHKIAIKSINYKEDVYKYGEIIGRAVKPISIGCHVHVDNLEGVTLKK